MAKEPVENKLEAEAYGRGDLGGLVGRAFHVWKKGNPDHPTEEYRDAHISHQGVVRAKVTETVYLVQFFNAWDGSPNDMELVDLSRMVTKSEGDRREDGYWQFFANDLHMRNWDEEWGKNHK